RRAAGRLHRRPAGRRRLGLELQGEEAVSAGVYVHVPFCLTRCGYCDFNAYDGLGHLAGRYVDALRSEADLVAPAWAGNSFGSVFFGGGTPTTLEPAALAGVLEHLRNRFAISADAEITT